VLWLIQQRADVNAFADGRHLDPHSFAIPSAACRLEQSAGCNYSSIRLVVRSGTGCPTPIPRINWCQRQVATILRQRRDVSHTADDAGFAGVGRSGCPKEATKPKARRRDVVAAAGRRRGVRRKEAAAEPGGLARRPLHGGGGNRARARFLTGSARWILSSLPAATATPLTTRRSIPSSARIAARVHR
jgi:hypothetical protein